MPRVKILNRSQPFVRHALISRRIMVRLDQWSSEHVAEEAAHRVVSGQTTRLFQRRTGMLRQRAARAEIPPAPSRFRRSATGRSGERRSSSRRSPGTIPRTRGGGRRSGRTRSGRPRAGPVRRGAVGPRQPARGGLAGASTLRRRLGRCARRGVDCTKRIPERRKASRSSGVQPKASRSFTIRRPPPASARPHGCHRPPAPTPRKPRLRGEGRARPEASAARRRRPAPVCWWHRRRSVGRPPRRCVRRAVPGLPRRPDRR